MTENELLTHLRSLIGYTDGTRVNAKTLASKLGFSQQYLGDVLASKRRISARLAEALGFWQVVTFEHKDADND